MPSPAPIPMFDRDDEDNTPATGGLPSVPTGSDAGSGPNGGSGAESSIESGIESGTGPELRFDQALAMWHGAIVESVRRESPDLSARQMAILLTVYLNPGPHTVRGLAALLDISKPAVSRALDTLGGHGLVRRKRDEEDRRNVLVQRTVKGSVYLREFADLIVAASKQSASIEMPESA